MLGPLPVDGKYFFERNVSLSQFREIFGDWRAVAAKPRPASSPPPPPLLRKTKHGFKRRLLDWESPGAQPVETLRSPQLGISLWAPLAL